MVTWLCDGKAHLYVGQRANRVTLRLLHCRVTGIRGMQGQAHRSGKERRVEHLRFRRWAAPICHGGNADGYHMVSPGEG